MRVEQMGMFEDNPSYDAFVDKFKPKKTTDDCYTPALVYDAVADWVAKEWNLNKETFVRPFWPEGDFERMEYPDGCVVVDNPPFSILTKILRFYEARGIRYFLFAPTLTLFSCRNIDTCYLPCGVTVTYENGAEVQTSFVTNLDTEYRVRVEPGLYAAVRAANEENRKQGKAELPKYSYPMELITAPYIYPYARMGISFRVRKEECRQVHALDAQREMGKTIFGSGFLISERAKAEREKAEREKAERTSAMVERTSAMVWELSERERKIVEELSRGDG